MHFVLIFPKDYPSSPPECRLFSPVPHPNVSPAVSVIPGLREARWRLALFDCVPTHSTWSCAYTVQSVLVQLQGKYPLVTTAARHAAATTAATAASITNMLNRSVCNAAVVNFVGCSHSLYLVNPGKGHVSEHMTDFTPALFNACFRTIRTLLLIPGIIALLKPTELSQHT